MSGVAEAIKTLNVAIPAFTGWRYVGFMGYGDNASLATTRLVEIPGVRRGYKSHFKQIANGRLSTDKWRKYRSSDKTGQRPMLQAIHCGGEVKVWRYYITIWATNYMIDKINVTGYSPVIDPDKQSLKFMSPTDNTNWTQVADYSANTTNQPEAGFDFPVPQG